MNVDEAGGQGEPFTRYPFESLPFREVTDECDPLIDDGDIGYERRISEPIVDLRALEDRM
jgi:hypothetical protein